MPKSDYTNWGCFKEAGILSAACCFLQAVFLSRPVPPMPHEHVQGREQWFVRVMLVVLPVSQQRHSENLCHCYSVIWRCDHMVTIQMSYSLIQTYLDCRASLAVRPQVLIFTNSSNQLAAYKIAHIATIMWYPSKMVMSLWQLFHDASLQFLFQ